MNYLKFFDEIRKTDVAIVGGKSANLGEMTSQVMVPVPFGFATTSDAYWGFIKKNKLWGKIERELRKIKKANDTKTLEKVSRNIQKIIKSGKMPEKMQEEIKKAYKQIGSGYVSVRSSATAEDLPGASFAGQQETYLNIKGEKKVIKKIIECYASLFTTRSIFYRIQKGFSHEKVALSAAIQKMVNSKVSGVMFTLDVRNGDKSKIIIEGSWGLGEYIVQGTVTPDDYFVDKKTMKIINKKISKEKKIMLVPTLKGVEEKKVPKKLQSSPVLTDDDIKKLAHYALELEKHYKTPQDIEWAKNEKGHLFILQTRPETVWSGKKQAKVKELKGKVILKGLAASPGFGTGVVKIIRNLNDIDKIRTGDILVTKMTNPDMVPAMKKAEGIITNEGGVTSHAAIVSRELGIPCVTGTEKATRILKEKQLVTVDGSEGVIYEGAVGEKKKQKYKNYKTKTKIYVNLGIPEIADKIAKKHVDGVGLMREEFIIATYIKKHPLWLIQQGKEKEFVDKLAKGIEKVTKDFKPRPVILRLSDLKTNEYRDLEGGKNFEPVEDNPMIGWRGCSRYIHPDYEPAFRLELQAIKRVRKKYKNLHIMLPFVRSINEVKKVTEILEEEGLKRTKNFKLYLMAEIPANILLADLFSQYCDGFSIGSNDLTQLTLGVDRDSELLAKMGEFDEQNLAVKRTISHLIKTAHRYGKTVGICGQAPSEYPEFTRFLVNKGIDTISVNPDVIEKTRYIVHEAEKKIKKMN